MTRPGGESLTGTHLRGKLRTRGRAGAL